MFYGLPVIRHGESGFDKGVEAGARGRWLAKTEHFIYN